MEKKELQADELESVNGGTLAENKEIVALYNKYHPEDPSTNLSVKVQLWVWDEMGYDYSNTSHNRPAMYTGNYTNQYQLPDYGLVNHREFMKILKKKLADNYG